MGYSALGIRHSAFAIRAHHSMRFYSGFLLFLVSLCSPATMEDTVPGTTSNLVVMTYNIHHAAGMDGRVDIDRIARIILEAEPDLVALQEVDRFVERTARADQAQQLADLTGMHMRFGFAINYQGGDFGNVILSRHPILHYTTYPLPGEPGEDRVLLHAKIVMDIDKAKADTVSFLATHLDTFTAPREAAVPLILDRIPEPPPHFYILAGDLNATPGSAVIETLKTRLILPDALPPTLTYPAQNPDRQIDYILYVPSAGWKLDDIRVISAAEASDHAPLVARFTYLP